MPSSLNSSPNNNTPRSPLPICVLISYNNALSPHLSTGDDRICCTGRTTGSGREGDCLGHDSLVDGAAAGWGGFVDGVALLEWDALAPFGNVEGGEGGA
jgi:hypothetical protein